MKTQVGHFLSLQRARWRPETLEKYERCLVDFLSWLAPRGPVPAEAVTPELIQEWIDSHAWSASSRHIAVSALRGFFRWSLGKARSPAELVVYPRRPLRPQRVLTAEQAWSLLTSIDTSRPKGVRDLAVIALALDTGLRSSELCHAELAYVNLLDRYLKAEVKGGKWGLAVFSSYTALALRQWISIRHHFARPGVPQLFVSIRGTKPGSSLTRYGLQIIVRKLGKDAGIGILSPHDFRRTMCTLSLRNGAPTRIVQVAGRWQSVTMVERYSQAIRPEDVDPYLPVGRIMGIPGP